MLYVYFLKRTKEKLLTSRAFVPLDGLEAGAGPSLGTAGGVSLVTASLSNLMDKNRKTLVQNVIDVR